MFSKNTQIPFLNENPSSGSRVVPPGQTDGQANMTKLIVAFRNFVNAPKISQFNLCREIIAVYSEIHTKHLNVLCGQNVELLNVKPGGTNSN
jgi:hypothetical protein